MILKRHYCIAAIQIGSMPSSNITEAKASTKVHKEISNDFDEDNEEKIIPNQTIRITIPEREKYWSLSNPSGRKFRRYHSLEKLDQLHNST